MADAGKILFLQHPIKLNRVGNDHEQHGDVPFRKKLPHGQQRISSPGPMSGEELGIFGQINVAAFVNATDILLTGDQRRKFTGRGCTGELFPPSPFRTCRTRAPPILKR